MLSVTIDRTALGLAALDVNSPGSGFAVVSLGPGTSTMRLDYARSPVSDGAVLTNARAEIRNALIVVRCYGTPAQIQANLEQVEAAVRQRTYTITVTIDGVTEQWQCLPATYARGSSGTYNADRLMAGWQDVTLDIPRQP